MSWAFSPLVVLAAVLVFPPLGLVLLWMRPSRAWKKLALTLPVLAVGFVHLVKFYGMRYELSGSGVPKFFTFRDKESHTKDLEQHRASQQNAGGASDVVEPPPVVQAAAPPEPVATHAATAANYWTDFRGPNRLGVYDEMPILTSWPAGGLRRLWKQPVGGGYASFVVVDGLLFTIEQRRDQEVVAAYDTATGREMWTNSWRAHFQESMGGDGPRTTPVWDAGRIYALGAEGELRCLDAGTGKVIWNKNILRENGAENLTWAQAASPLVVDGKLIVLPGGGKGKSVVAYDKLTGKPVWSSQDDEQSYTSPTVARVAGKRQLIVVSAVRMMGLTVEDGKLLWDYPWVTEYHVNAAQPIVIGENRVFISAGYGHGAAVVELTPSGDQFKVKEIWKNTKLKAKFNNPVLYQGHIYGMDEGIMACIDPASGDQKWKGGRYGYGQVLLASGHLVVTTEQGEVVLVKATPAGHQELARFAGVEGKTWNHPAIANGVLFVRNTTEMAAFRIGR
jgi:outer membrane protein assembly factor BamB